MTGTSTTTNWEIFAKFKKNISMLVILVSYEGKDSL